MQHIAEPTVEQTPTALAQSAANCAYWLETMRVQGGFGGPVVHWWQHALMFTGAGIDWRYEGIISGYLDLYRASGLYYYLDRAVAAANDIVNGQDEYGNYANSQFQLNPYTAGTPHEAAVDIALLNVASRLKAEQAEGWEGYIATARRSIENFYIRRLWNAERRCFFDDTRSITIVPNKVATLFIALARLSELSGDSRYLDAYGLPALNHCLSLQNGRDENRGAFAQYIEQGRPVNWYFPYYNARIVPALVLAHDLTGNDTYLAAAVSTMQFILRHIDADGGLPQVVYADRRANRYPRWVAGAGDVILAGLSLVPHGFAFDYQPTLDWILGGQLESGGFQTAHGFESQGSQKTPPSLPHAFDLLPVAGWTDKAFALLCRLLPDSATIPAPTTGAVMRDCVFRGKPARFHEDDDVLDITQEGTILYEWRKGDSWARTVSPAMLWR